MTYGCQIWGHSPTNSYVDTIQVLHNNFIRLISFAPNFRDHVRPLYSKLKLLKFKDMIMLEKILFIHDYFNGKLPNSFDKYFILDKDKDKYPYKDIRPTHIPGKFKEYVLIKLNMQPQESPIPGQIYKPTVETVRYGIVSIKLSSINSCNLLNRKYF